jgi:hypothetical protein
MAQIFPGSLGGIVIRVTTLQLAIRTVTVNTTLLDTDFTVEVDAAAGNITITLPTAISQYDGGTSSGRIYNVKKIDSTANTVTITPQGGDTIDGLASIIISAKDVDYTLQSDGTRWIRL